MDKISTNGLRFVDDYGRERIFNGINIVDKSGGFDGTAEEYIKNWDFGVLESVKKRGMNLIRLGFTWALVEPKPGVYNEAFLDAVGLILDKCAQLGIYAYLDMHQDLYSGAGGYGGDGAPAWACLKGGYEFKPAKFVWAEGYFWGRAVQNCFDSFWADKKVDGKGLIEYYCDMWKHVTQRFADKPALFGFDPMNEPYPGSDGGKVFRKLVAKTVRVTLLDRQLKRTKMLGDLLHKSRRPRLLDHYTGDVFRKITAAGDDLIRKFDLERYSPFLNRVSSAIREVTPGGIVFMENCYYSNLGIPCSTPPVEVGGMREPLQCFEPHAYDFMVDTPSYKFASNDRISAIFNEHRRTQVRLGVPVVVGEWGGYSEGTEWFPHVKHILAIFDANKWSNTYWAYFKGLFETPLINVLDRPYPAAVPGEIVSYRHDREEESFSLCFEQTEPCEAPVEIYLHKPAKRIETGFRTETADTSGFGGALLKVYSEPGRHLIKITF